VNFFYIVLQILLRYRAAISAWEDGAVAMTGSLSYATIFVVVAIYLVVIGLNKVFFYLM